MDFGRLEELVDMENDFILRPHPRRHLILCGRACTAPASAHTQWHGYPAGNSALLCPAPQMHASGKAAVPHGCSRPRADRWKQLPLHRLKQSCAPAARSPRPACDTLALPPAFRCRPPVAQPSAASTQWQIPPAVPYPRRSLPQQPTPQSEDSPEGLVNTAAETGSAQESTPSRSHRAGESL